MNTTAKARLLETIQFIEGAYAPSTIRAYRENFEKFILFCNKLNEEALPASNEAVTEYVKEIADGRLKSSSIRIAIASISAIHRLNQLTDPTTHPEVKIEIRRMHRLLGRESKQALGINSDMLNRMVNITDSRLVGLRDRALLLTAYDGLLRRSELISLRVEDIVNNRNDSFKIKLRRSKTDQDGLGRWLYLSNQTQAAIANWLEAAQINSGNLFRAINRANELSERLSASQVNRIYKKLARKLNLEPHLVKRISGHSIRVGAAQDLMLSGSSLPIIMAKGRWSKTDTMMRYVEQADYPNRQV
jgi:site-specific recombinase XerD